VSNAQFEWDQAKNLANQRKHGVSFEEAAQVFRDPLYLSWKDRIQYGEDRWQACGMVEGLALLIVAQPSGKKMKTETKSKWFASSPPEGQTPKKGAAMKKKMVRYTLDALPPLTDAQRANLKSLSARPAIEIDTSDIPVLSDAEWAKTKRVRGHLYRPVKQIVTARLDGDVLEWLKSHGRGYQSRMNAILRREMLSSIK
jgi:uncharacterized protein (DUF4415 family)/uncharacterized DUF497 family protein